MGKCQRQALPQPARPWHGLWLVAALQAKTPAPPGLLQSPANPLPSCRLQSGRGVRPCQEKLSRGLPVRWDRRLGCQHHLTRFNLKVLFKKSKANKDQKNPKGPEHLEKNLPQHGRTQPQRCPLSRRAEAPRTSPLLRLSAAAQHPETWGRP